MDVLVSKGRAFQHLAHRGLNEQTAIFLEFGFYPFVLHSDQRWVGPGLEDKIILQVGGTVHFEVYARVQIFVAYFGMGAQPT